MKQWLETREVLDRLAELRRIGQRAALATVVRVRGSAYRHEGAKLLVAEDGTTTGNVSGGCLGRDGRGGGRRGRSGTAGPEWGHEGGGPRAARHGAVRSPRDRQPLDLLRRVPAPAAAGAVRRRRRRPPARAPRGGGGISGDRRGPPPRFPHGGAVPDRGRAGRERRRRPGQAGAARRGDSCRRDDAPLRG